MAWCEQHRVDYVFGLARNARLEAKIAPELAQAEAPGAGDAASRRGASRTSAGRRWTAGSRRRRVVAKAEWTQGEANPRFVVTSLKPKATGAAISTSRSTAPAARWRTASRSARPICSRTGPRPATMRANQLRLWFASMAYVLLCALRRIGLPHTQFAEASCGTIRLKLLKIGALVRVSVRRIKFAMASGCPWQHEWSLVHARLRNAAA